MANNYLGDLELDKKVILRWVLKKWSVRIWTLFIWLTIRLLKLHSYITYSTLNCTFSYVYWIHSPFWVMFAFCFDIVVRQTARFYM